MATSRICSRALIYLLFILESKQIFASFVNVALNKPVYQSSYEDKNFYDPARAVDSVTSGNYEQCITTATNKNYTWFEVDLKNTYFVFEVKIYFRYDYTLRRNGVQVYANTAANASNTGHLCGSVTGSKNEIVNITCNVNARYVTVYQGTDNGGSTALDFVELEVYTCQTGYYDSSCDKLCSIRHCQQNSPCPADTGSCTGGCQAGWTGSDCIQACTRYISYGPNCIKLCQNRHCALENPPCDIYRGDCGTSGCQAGWKGTDCTQACTSQSTYGPNCNKNCKDRHCASTNAPCDVQYGNCGNGRCEAGWKRTDCTQECTRHINYEPNCIKLCQNRHCALENPPCDIYRGDCGTSGCQAGWKGTDCTQVSSKKETVTCKPSSEKTTITALSITTGMLSLFVIILIVVIIWLLRIRNRSNTSEHAVSFAKTERTQSRAAATSSALYEVPHEDMSRATRNDDQRNTTDMSQSHYENTSYQTHTSQEINDYDRLDTDVGGQGSPYDKIKT